MESSSEDELPSFSKRFDIDIAPKIVDADALHEEIKKSEFISANLPKEKQEKYLEAKPETAATQVTILDSIWKKMHHKQKKNEKKQNSHIHKRDIPWDPFAQKHEETGIYERTVYFERQKNRTWHTQIGDEILEDTAIWFNSIPAKDHLGRSWVLPPLSLHAGMHECAIAKQVVHTFSYHTSYVTNVEMFPDYGHIFLSSSLDSTVRVWSVTGDRQCLQSYVGHSKGVSDCAFTRDGLKFASCCYGKKLKLWDTDSGKVYNTAILDDVPSRIAIPGTEEHAEEVLVCLANGNVSHYDFRADSSKAPPLTYSGHSKGVLSVAIVPGSKYFITSSEDNSLLLWELGMQKPISKLSENWMKPVTALAAHPTEPVAIGQMAHKELAVFSYEHGKLVPDKQRSFVGNMCDSFPCRPSISPDGKFVVQGDKIGNVHVWDWKSAKMLRTYSFPNRSVVSKAQWSPLHPSQVVCSCYDNNLYLLD